MVRQLILALSVTNRKQRKTYMAILKAIPLGSTGVNAEYWNIGEKKEDVRSKCLEVQLFGYASEEVRHTEGSNPLFSKSVIIANEEYTRDMNSAAIYDAIKARETGDFVGAVDA